MKTIILASGSAARQELLRGAGVSVTFRPSDVDEAAIKKRLLGAGVSARDIAEALADAKAIAAPIAPDVLVIGADQTLEVGGRLLDKTNNIAETQARLLSLRGRTFNLHSAVSGAAEVGVIWRHTQTATLTMRPYSRAFLDDYLARNGGELATSLAGFAIEGEGVQLFERIEGDYFAILGLPLIPLLGWLREAGGLPS